MKNGRKESALVVDIDRQFALLRFSDGNAEMHVNFILLNLYSYIIYLCNIKLSILMNGCIVEIASVSRNFPKIPSYISKLHSFLSFNQIQIFNKDPSSLSIRTPRRRYKDYAMVASSQFSQSQSQSQSQHMLQMGEADPIDGNDVSYKLFYNTINFTF